MGAADDAESPLTPDLRVKGSRGSAGGRGVGLSGHTTVNPNLAVLMVGEKCAYLILSEARPSIPSRS